ncbi:MAG: hypothetical protein WBD31_27385, partial [Rubripirellula sp.]
GTAVTRIFTPANALIAQVVDVTAFNDSLFEGPHSGLISISVSSIDTAYNGLTLASFSSAIIDDDTSKTLTLAGEVEEFIGPGTYNFDFYVTATGGTQELRSWNIPFAFDLPGATFSGSLADFQPNAAFSQEAVAPLNSPFTADFGLAGSVGQMTLVEGQPVSLFTISLVVDETASITTLTEIGQVVSSGFDANFFAFFDENNQRIPTESIVVGSGFSLAPDLIPPTITDVKIAGSGWSSAFLQFSDPGFSEGVSLPGADQLKNLAWSNLDTIVVEFSEEVQQQGGTDVGLGNLSLMGLNIPDYKSTIGLSTSYSNGGGSGPYLLTISLLGGETFGPEKLLLAISDTVQDTAGNSLDGEWVDSASEVSGDSTEGGDFNFRIDLLPGDVSNDDFLLGDDIDLIAAQQFTFAGGPEYNPFSDINGDGFLLGDDTDYASVSQFTFLPFGVPAPPPSTSASAGSPKSVLLPLLGDEKVAWSEMVDELLDTTGKLF